MKFTTENAETTELGEKQKPKRKLCDLCALCGEKIRLK